LDRDRFKRNKIFPDDWDVEEERLKLECWLGFIWNGEVPVEVMWEGGNTVRLNAKGMAKANGRKFMTPAEFLGRPNPGGSLLQGYKKALVELEIQDLTGIAETIAKARRVFIAGNGGSAMTATHLASDLARAGVQAYSLCDNPALITGLANDLGYAYIFSRQLELYNVGEGDVFIAISGSGNSTNIITAVNLANNKGATTIALVGFGGGQLSPLVDKAIVLSSSDYGEVEGIHSCLCHIIPRLLVHG